MQTKQERHTLLNTERENPRHEIIGLLWFALSALFLAISGLLVRFVTGYESLPPSTMTLVRGTIQTTLVSFGILVVPGGREAFQNAPRLLGLLAVHGISGAFELLAVFGSFKLLDLSVASAIFRTSPVMVLLFGSIALQEPIRPRIALAAFFSILGAIMVTDPFMQDKPTSILGVILGCSAATLNALQCTTLRALATQASSLAAVLSFGMFSALLGLLTGGTMDLFKSASNSWIAVLSQFLAVCAQCSIAKGSEYCTAGKGALVGNIGLPLAYIFGIVFLAEVPNIVSVSGGVLILAATLIIAHEAMECERQQEGE